MKDDGHKELLNQSGWKSLQNRCFMHRVIFVLQCTNMIGPNIFNNYFFKSSHEHNREEILHRLLTPETKNISSQERILLCRS